MRVPAHFWPMVCAGAVVMAAGCGVKPVPTGGVVTFDGKPLANATVIFTPDDPAGKAATGYTNAAGAFQLAGGAMPGSYRITVIHSEPTKVPPGTTPNEVKEAMAGKTRKPSEVPEIYTRLDQTPLTHRVPEDRETKIALVRGRGRGGSSRFRRLILVSGDLAFSFQLEAYVDRAIQIWTELHKPESIRRCR